MERLPVNDAVAVPWTRWESSAAGFLSSRSMWRWARSREGDGIRSILDIEEIRRPRGICAILRFAMSHRDVTMDVRHLRP
jgi:hypothetical protein